MRRACSRSSEEIVCRLFFTRWWIPGWWRPWTAAGGPPAQLADVPDEHDSAGGLALEQGMRMTTVTPRPLDLVGHGYQA
jgi:hypothetical protein